MDRGDKMPSLDPSEPLNRGAILTERIEAALETALSVPLDQRSEKDENAVYVLELARHHMHQLTDYVQSLEARIGLAPFPEQYNIEILNRLKDIEELTRETLKRYEH